MNAIKAFGPPYERDAMPNRFTGNFRGQHYYKGRVWEGPTNAVGQGARPATFVRKPRAKCDTRGPNSSPSVDVEVCAREGGLVITAEGRVRARTAGVES
jgi:hypothetical protein